MIILVGLFRILLVRTPYEGKLVSYVMWLLRNISLPPRVLPSCFHEQNGNAKSHPKVAVMSL
jgi:hypothetical protein